MDEVMTNCVTLAIEEVLLNIIEHGNEFDQWQLMRVRVEFQKEQLKAQICNYGQPYDITKHKDISLKSSLAKGLKRGVCGFLFFSSRRRHTSYIGDWSSDVCSSD